MMRAVNSADIVGSWHCQQSSLSAVSAIGIINTVRIISSQRYWHGPHCLQSESAFSKEDSVGIVGSRQCQQYHIQDCRQFWHHRQYRQRHSEVSAVSNAGHVGSWQCLKLANSTLDSVRIRGLLPLDAGLALLAT